MTVQFSQRFLDRIATYPAKVQEQLKSGLDEDAIRAATTVLHGKPQRDKAALDGVMERFPVLDGLLGQLVGSNRFEQNIKEILKRLRVEDVSIVQQTIKSDLEPLSDPCLPYIYKVKEASEKGSEAAVCLLSIIDMMRALDPKSGDLEFSIAQLIQDGQSVLLPDLAAQWIDERLDHLAPPAASFMSPGEANAVVRGLLAGLSRGHPGDFICNQLRSCRLVQGTQVSDAGQLPVLGAVDVLLPEDAKTDCLSWWQEKQSSGLVGQIVSDKRAPADWSRYVAFTANVRPGLIELAYLSRLAAVRNSVPIKVEGSGTSFEQRIVGHPHQDAHQTVVGHLVGDRVPSTEADAGGLVWNNRDPDLGISLPTPTPDDCYAILVTLDEAVDLSRFINHEACIAVHGLDGLRKRFEGQIEGLVGAKPVVFVSSYTPSWPDYIIETVQSYWRFCGKFPVSPVLVDVDQRNGALYTTDGGRPGLGHVAPASVLGLPLPRALDLATTRPDVVNGIEQGIYVDPGHVVVRHYRVADDFHATIGRAIESTLAGTDFAPQVRDMVHLWGGAVEPDLAYALNGSAFWPLAANLRALRANAPMNLGRLNDPSLTDATDVLRSISEQGRGGGLPEGFDTFAVGLSRRPAVLAELDGDLLTVFFEKVIACRAIADIAGNLAIAPDEICRNDPELTIPYFRALVAGLSGEDLQAAISNFAVKPEETGKAFFRLAEVYRRYANDTSMLRFLRRVITAHPELLDHKNFLRNFARLVGPMAPRDVTTFLDPDVIRGIQDAVDFEDAFEVALQAGDRAKAVDLLSRLKVSHAFNFMKWAERLRGFSNELRALRLSVHDIKHPDMNNLSMRVLFGVLFSDVQTLRDMQDSGLLDGGAGPHLVARQMIGDHGPLNDYLADLFKDGEIAPLCILGNTTKDVFEAASEKTDAYARKGARKRAPLVSVIVSAFDPDIELLELSLMSVLNQSHDNVEVIVIDDRSSPSSHAQIADLVERLAGPVRLMVMHENSGPYVGRNRAIAEAAGEFIAIQDADDWSHPDRFAEQLSLFDADPFVQLVTASHVRIDKAGCVQLEARLQLAGDGPMTSMFRRQAFENVGMFAPVRSRGDVEMRERIRSYFGPHAVCELPMPLMLCFADSQTLSQRTRNEKREVLQIFRTNISTRKDLRAYRKIGISLSSDDAIQVPVSLRAPIQDPESDRSAGPERK